MQPLIFANECTKSLEITLTRNYNGVVGYILRVRGHFLMRMLTLNCHSLLDYDSDRQIREIVDQIVRERIDVLALQETNQSQMVPAVDADVLALRGYVAPKVDRSVIRRDNFAYRLSCALQKVKLEYSWSWTCVYGTETGLELGVALFSRLPLNNVHSAEISSMNLDERLRVRRVLLAQLDDEVQTVVSTVHFNGEDPDEFHFEWENLMKMISLLGLDEYPVYLLGNFNVDAEIDRRSYKMMCRRFEDTYCLAMLKGDGMTVRGALDGWDDSGISERLDYILTNAENDVIYSRVCFDGSIGPRISNHAGVLIEVADGAETYSA